MLSKPLNAYARALDKSGKCQLNLVVNGIKAFIKERGLVETNSD